jgi:glyoxylase-like metal-dependent hydrolase (beta-lactamase superfamily II)
MGALRCECFPCGPIETNFYVLWDPNTFCSVLVDAPPESFSAYENFSRRQPNKPQAMLLTHGHWDHMAEAAKFQKTLPLPVYVGAGDADWVRHPEIMGDYVFGNVEIFPCEADMLLSDGAQLKFLNHNWLVRTVAGHTPGGLVYAIPGEDIAFTGDSIFRGSVGRSDLPGGDGNLLVAQLRDRMRSFSPKMRLYPGHGPATTVGNEMDGNPFL